MNSIKDRMISRLQFGHAGVHFGVHQPKGKSFVSYQGLIVTLVIRYVFLSIAAVLRTDFNCTVDL